MDIILLAIWDVQIIFLYFFWCFLCRFRDSLPCSHWFLLWEILFSIFSHLLSFSKSFFIFLSFLMIDLVHFSFPIFLEHLHFFVKAIIKFVLILAMLLHLFFYLLVNLFGLYHLLLAYLCQVILNSLLSADLHRQLCHLF